MKFRSSHVLIVAAVAALGAGPAAAQFKPTKPVELITHTGPGGGGDVIARAIAQIIDKNSLSPVRYQVANKTGGGGLTAMAYIVNEKKGDDHAIGVFTGNWTTNPLVRKEAKATIKDMTPIVRLVLEPALVAVKADSKYKTLKDVVAAAKQNPGQVKQSGGSLTSRDNVVRQLLMKNSGANWAFISFPGGGERIAALLGGHVDMMIIEPQEAGEHIKAGNLRVIAQVNDSRLPAFPNIPTLKEAGFDVPNVPQVRGIVAPPGISPAAVSYYEEVFAKMVKTPEWQKYLADNYFQDGFMRSAELSKFFDEFIVTMRNILKETGAKVVR